MGIVRIFFGGIFGLIIGVMSAVFGYCVFVAIPAGVIFGVDGDVIMTEWTEHPIFLIYLIAFSLFLGYIGAFGKDE